LKIRVRVFEILKKQGGCGTLCGLAIYIIKTYLTAKEELWKLKYFTMQKTNLIFQKQKQSSKRNQNPSRYYNSRRPHPSPILASSSSSSD